MADEVRKEVIVDIKLDEQDAEKRVGKLTKTIAELRADTEKLTNANKELEKYGRKNSDMYLENSKGIEINKQLISEATSERKSLIQVMLSEDKSIKGLTLRNKELIKQRNEISTATVEGRAQIALINKEIDENSEIIRENSAAHEQQQKNIGNYASALDNLKPGLGSFVKGHSEMLAGLTKGAAILGGVTAAAGAVFAAYIKGERGARDFAKAQDLLSSATENSTNAFSDWIDELTGGSEDGMGFLERLTFGALAYLDASLAATSFLQTQAKDALRELEISRRFANAFYKDDERRAELNRRIRDDESRAFEERIRAAEQVDRFMKNAGDRQIIVMQAQIDKIKESTVNYDLNREAQLRVAELEAEIADKREEITGKLTENTTAVLRLRQEYAELQRSVRLERYEEELQRQHELFLEQQVKRDEERKREEEIIKNFNKRIADDLKKRLDDEDKAQKKALKDYEIIQKLRVQATVGGLAIVAKEQSAARIIGNTILQKDAIKETFINTRAAAMAAYKSLASIPIIGPALGAAAAAAAILYGGSQVAAIAGIQFANGGKVPGYAGGGLSGTKIQNHHGIPIQRSNGDNRLATVKTGEVILNEHHQRLLGGDKTFRAIGVPGFADGGITGSLATSSAARSVQDSIERREMLEALSAVRTVLVLQDFESAMEAKNTPINNAQVI